MSGPCVFSFFFHVLPCSLSRRHGLSSRKHSWIQQSVSQWIDANRQCIFKVSGISKLFIFQYSILCCQQNVSDILTCKCKKCFNITNIIGKIENYFYFESFVPYQSVNTVPVHYKYFYLFIPIYLFQLCFTTALHLCPACLSLKLFHAHFQFD